MSINTTIPWPAEIPEEDWPKFEQLILRYLQNRGGEDVTPVRTGRLKRGWQVDAGPDGLTLINEVPYAVWQNDGNTRGLQGRNMTGRAQARLGDLM